MKCPTSVLCLDAGNTLLKWCVHPDYRLPLSTDVEVFRHPSADFSLSSPAQSNLLERLLVPVLSHTGQVPAAVLLSNVLGPAFEQAVAGICERFGVPLHVLLPHSHSGLRSSYSNPLSLGKDRWAACLAITAVSQSPVNLLVSFGTATTLDAVVQKDGWKHLGGYIVPGVKTMFDSLHLNTAELPAVELPPSSVDVSGAWPSSTHQAISWGVAGLQVAMVRSLNERLTREFRQSPSIWLSGGFAAQLHDALPEALLFEHAVFKGLLLDYQLTRQPAA